MNILGCLDKASSGEYYLSGKETSCLSKNELAELRNRIIGFVFQGFNLIPRQTLLDNVALPLVYAGVATDERKKQSHQQALSHIGLVSLILCCGIVIFSINEETVIIPVAYIVGLLALFVLYLAYRIRK